jgi:hypothetical protein
MGWIISVGQAGVKGRQAGRQAGGQTEALMLSVDVHGTAARIKLYPDARTEAIETGAASAWQAQRVWQNVLSTLVGH